MNKLGTKLAIHTLGGALLTGVAIARQAHLGLEVDLHREQGRSPLHIVQH